MPVSPDKPALPPKIAALRTRKIAGSNFRLDLVMGVIAKNWNYGTRQNRTPPPQIPEDPVLGGIGFDCAKAFQSNRMNLRDLRLCPIAVVPNEPLARSLRDPVLG
jgi:hypothetical protein